VSSANRRAALGAVDRVRPVVAGLVRTKPNEELAAELSQAWDLTEVALRALLGGSTAAGQGLVRELRTRELLTLEQAHALLNFHGARDRAELPGYQVVAADVASAREAVAALDQALGGTVPSGGAESDFLPPPSPSAAAAGLPAGAAPVVDRSTVPARRGVPSWLVLALIVLVVVVLPVLGWWAYTNGRGGGMAQAQELYAAGRRDAARLAFAEVARDNPELALPHVYLARIAREQNDIATAQQELQEAIRIDPRSALAQREMGSLMLATGNAELARRFYTRAIELNPDDRLAVGYTGCALMRLGRPDVATRFLRRAGPGEWTACAQPAPPPAAAPAPVP
jgi:tetratricopeptide (TPR) repeat protein